MRSISRGPWLTRLVLSVSCDRRCSSASTAPRFRARSMFASSDRTPPCLHPGRFAVDERRPPSRLPRKVLSRLPGGRFSPTKPSSRGRRDDRGGCPVPVVPRHVDAGDLQCLRFIGTPVKVMLRARRGSGLGASCSVTLPRRHWHRTAAPPLCRRSEPRWERDSAPQPSIGVPVDSGVKAAEITYASAPSVQRGGRRGRAPCPAQGCQRSAHSGDRSGAAAGQPSRPV
jgi:hypothetical protein